MYNYNTNHLNFNNFIICDINVIYMSKFDRSPVNYLFDLLQENGFHH